MATGFIRQAILQQFIRQKLISSIDSIEFKEAKTQSGLSFLPEGEWHELGLLFFITF